MYAWYCYMLKQNEPLIKNVIPIIRALDLITIHMKDNLSDGTSKIDVRMYDFVKNYRCVVLPVNVAASHSRGPAQACGSG